MFKEIIEGYRLSPQQRHLWLLEQYDRSAVCAVRVNGKLDFQALQQAIRKVVTWHETLRTTFKLLPAMTIPLQVISDDSDVTFVEHDVSHLAVDDQEARIKTLFISAAEGKIDYEQFPLFRIDQITRSSSEHVLIISLPALCADAPSLQCLVSQIAAAYKASVQNEQLDIEAMQYADFAEWQNELLEAEEHSAAGQFWRQQDLSELDNQKLSFEKRITAHTTFQPATLPLSIPADVSARIKAIATRYDVPRSSFALACWQILISRLTGHSSTVVGVALDGRKFSEVEEAIGLFSRFLPIRVELPLSLSFDQLLKQTSEHEHEAHRWQEYFAWDNVSNDKVKARFFPFCFESRNGTVSYSGGNAEFSVYEWDACTDRFKIKFVFQECEGEFSASLQFDAGLFSNGDVRRLSEQLKTLIDDASKKPEAALADLELLSDAERQTLLVEFNETARRYPKGQTVHGLFEDQVVRKPDDVAVVYEDERLTYRELNARANRLAHHLLRLGVGPDVVVGLCLDRSVELIVGMLGIIKAGGAYLPLDPGVPKPRLRMILEDAGARLLVTRGEAIDVFADQLDRVVSIDRDAHLIASESDENPVTTVSDRNLVYVIFTSGSTGRPKGVAVEHRQLVNYINAIWEKLDLPGDSSFATVSTIAADLGNTALFPALCKGGTLHLIAEERATDPDALAEYFSRNQIDCLKIVPTHLSALLSGATPAAIVPRRRLVLGGETSSWGLVKKLASLSAECVVVNHYGPTEGTVGALSNRVCEDGTEIVSDTVPLGRPLANVQAYVLDERMQPAPFFTAGKLYIGGAGLARGYINRADATAEKFIPNPFGNSGERLYNTGDLARYLGDGRIEFLGRSDDQVKIHGYRIELGEIEHALLNCDEVAECVVVAREDQPGDKRLVAYVVSRDHEKTSASHLRTFLRGRLPEYMTPSAFVALDRLPLTANGKVDRRALPAPDHSGADRHERFTEPRNEIEATLAQIWSNVLGVDRVGVHDNFFDLGGDSILSIQIIARANQAGLGLTPRQLFQHQTVAELATVASASTTAVAEQGVVTGSVPLTPVQTRFFELDQPELHHYNQSMLLEVQGPVSAPLLERATAGLLLQHDALRLRFARNEHGWQAQIAPPDTDVPFEIVDLSHLAESEQTRAFEDHAARLHASLNLQDGPLMRVALFDRGSQQNNYLLIVIHHLAVDGVSWRVLVEDLEALYQQHSRGETPSLPPKTTSFKTWAERLREHARSSVLRDELSYWLAIGDHSPVRLPLDKVGGTNTVADARTVSVSLNADDTRALLQDVPAAYRTQINEVLLTALVRAFARWTGSRSLLIDLEGHGREEIFEGVDLSRTVGWFTTIFPGVLNCGNAQSAIEDLRSMKEQLRLIPNRGIGYGLLRYGSGDPYVAKKLETLPQAEVRFNYLGQVDRVLADASMFSVAPESSGPAQSAGAQRAYLLNIIGMVSGGELRLDWTYSTSIHSQETVEHLAQSFVEELRALIARSRTGDKIDYSPSDFPRANLSQDELNKVLAKLRG